MRYATTLYWFLAGVLVLAFAFPPAALADNEKETSPLAIDPVPIQGDCATEVLEMDPHGEKPAATPVEIPPLPEDLDDPAFEKFIDIRALGRAWSELDAAGTLDAALLLAEGERVLLRSHKALTADDVLRLALSMAIEARDTEVLERLTTAADRMGNECLADEIRVAKKLVAEPRAPRVALSIDEFSVDEIMAFKSVEVLIRSATLSGDKEVLEEIRGILLAGLEDQMPEEMLLALKEEAEAALEAVQAAPEGASPSADILGRLAAASRSARMDFLGYTAGVPYFRDTASNIGINTWWTVTRGPYAPTRQRYEQAQEFASTLNAVSGFPPGSPHAWRLPHFHELRHLNPIHGSAFQSLQIRTGLWDGYWVQGGHERCGVPFGNGFQTLRQTIGVGNNWAVFVSP